jgi:hypothetical protein
VEPVDATRHQYYDRLLAVLRQPTVRGGQWRLLECVPARKGNWTWDGFMAWCWQGRDGERLLIAVNHAGNQGQCYVRLPFDELRGHPVRLQDRMSSAVYDRSGDDLLAHGLYLDLRGWGYHIFDVSRPP